MDFRDSRVEKGLDCNLAPKRSDAGLASERESGAWTLGRLGLRPSRSTNSALKRSYN